MMIKNLSVSNELDAKAMSALSGGVNQTIIQGNFSGSAGAFSSNGGLGSSTAVSVVAPQQTNLATQYAEVQPVAVALNGNAFAFGA